jgi:hypothetical protein
MNSKKNKESTEKSINGKLYINTLSHPVTIKVDNMLYSFESKTNIRPEVIYEQAGEVEEAGLRGISRKVKEIKYLPKPRKGVVYIVNGYILDAVCELDPMNFEFYEAPGPQIKGKGGVIIYAEGMIKKPIVAKKANTQENK